MVTVIRVHKFGGPEVLTCDDIALPAPGAGEVRVRHHACGVNYIDTYFRTGLYPAALPFVLGHEAAGEVTAVGPGVAGLKVGDRVAYYLALGCYAAERNAPAACVVKLPDAISYQQAAVLMLKGQTVYYLLHKTFKVQSGHIVLIHAAAGGIGVIATQWAHALGATVIGTAGSKEKAEIARANGCDHVILYREEDFAARVKEITKGALCDVVYDGVGKDTFMGSLNCLKRRGLLVSFGNASGAVPPFSPLELSKRGSLFLTRPTLADYLITRAELEESAQTTFSAFIDGKFRIPVNHTYALKDARQAHLDLEGRKTTGASILLP